MSVTLEGFEQLIQKFEQLGTTGVRKATRAAFIAGNKVGKQAIKSAVPAQYKDARKAVGSTVKVKADGVVLAKIGGAVGMSQKRLKKGDKPAGQRGGPGQKPGLGIGARNIHWLLAGTAPRWTGAKTTGRKGRRKKKATGHKRKYVGKMPAQGAVKQGWEASQAAVEQTIVDTFTTEIEFAAR